MANWKGGYIVNIKQQEMVLKVIVLMLIYGVLGYSGFSLIGLLSEHGSQLQQDIFIKLQFFFYMHIFVAVAIVPLLKLEDPFHTMLYSFFACLILFLAFFVCQKVTHGQKKEDGELLNQFDKSQDESTYVQYYYIVYGAALTGAGVTGFVVVASQILSYLRGPPVTRYDGILQTVDFNESLQGTQCSICLNDCTKEQTYSMIKKCGHIFHQDCLKEWLKYDKVCPLDRTNIMP